MCHLVFSCQTILLSTFLYLLVQTIGCILFSDWLLVWWHHLLLSALCHLVVSYQTKTNSLFSPKERRLWTYHSVMCENMHGMVLLNKKKKHTKNKKIEKAVLFSMVIIWFRVTIMGNNILDVSKWFILYHNGKPSSQESIVKMHPSASIKSDEKSWTFSEVFKALFLHKRTVKSNEVMGTTPPPKMRC